jgi:hypothetical protein
MKKWAEENEFAFQMILLLLFSLSLIAYLRWDDNRLSKIAVVCQKFQPQDTKFTITVCNKKEK